MSTRRLPPGTQSTAVIQRPQFSSDAVVTAARDSDDGPGERTDPLRRLAPRASSVHELQDDVIGDDDLDDSLNDTLDPSIADDGIDDDSDNDTLDGVHPYAAATGRYDLSSFDDFNAGLPSAHVSEFDVSDLDGDVDAGGAATAIMHLPPSLLAYREPDDAVTPAASDVSLRKWSAGPPGMKVAAPPPEVVAERLDDDDQMAATLPALSLAAVRAAALAAGVDAWPQHMDAPLPLPPPVPSLAVTSPPTMPAAMPRVPVSTVPLRRLAVTSADVSTGPRRRLRVALEDALSAVSAAQTTADSGHVPPGLHGHLERAFELLSRAIDIADDD